MLLPDTDEAGAEVIAARILQAVRGLNSLAALQLNSIGPLHRFSAQRSLPVNVRDCWFNRICGAC